jgi:hypothetical protein
MPGSITPATVVPGVEAGEMGPMQGGRRTRGATAKQLKKMLKKAGLKTSGRKAALTRRAKKAHLKMRGGQVMESGKPVEDEPTMGARRRKSRRSRGFRLY